MMSGGFPPLHPYGDPGDPGLGNRVDGVFAGRSFPEWGDSRGDFGQMRVLRLEGVDKDLPKRPFEIRKAVEAFLGIRIKEAYPEKNGVSYIIKLRNKNQIDQLKRMDRLPDGSPIKISDHPTRNQCRCVVYCPESKEYTTEELLSELKDQNVKDIRRITKKEGSKDVPTPTIILTIDGTVVPQSVSFGWIMVRTRPYYPTPMLCYGCFEYGHPKKRCSAKNLVCGVCCGNHANTPENPCQENAFCKHCQNGTHSVASKKCPVYLKEVDIQHLMVDQGIGYPAARRIYESNHKSKTAATLINESNDARFAELNQKFDKLLVETGKKDQQLETMKRETEIRDQQINTLFAVIEKKDQIIAEKESRIAALEAALAAANIKIPQTTNITGSTLDNLNVTETTTETIKATGAIKKTTTTCTDNNEATQRKSRSRSRSPRKPSQHNHSKDRRWPRGTSKHDKRLELQSSHDQNNKSAENKQEPVKEKSRKKKDKLNSKSKLSSYAISDDDESAHSQAKIDTSGNIELSSDEPQGDDLMEELP